VGALTNWAQVSAGNVFTAAVKTDGTLWTWGRNDFFGPLGHGNNINRSSPVQVGALTTWAQAAAGSFHMGCTTTAGTLFTWGAAYYGQLGHNNQTNRSSPVQVGALTTWAQLAGGNNNSTICLTTSGTLFAWGRNNVGQLGQNNTTNFSSPVQVGALTTWEQISAGDAHVAAVTTAGALWTWGGGGDGKLGQGNTTNFSSPVQVGALTDWAQVSAGGAHTAAILQGQSN
jgi:hypothetical protein